MLSTMNYAGLELFKFTFYGALNYQILKYGNSLFVFVLKIYGPVNPTRSYRAQSVYQTTLFTGQALSSKRSTSACAHSFARN